MTPTVGFIGLGQIGGPMALRLLDWPGGLVVCDAVAAATVPFAEGGATVVATPGEVGAAATVISVMVRDDAQVREVVEELLPSAAPGTVIAIHSTIRAETAQDLAEQAGPHQVAVIDAPVSGGAMGAHGGTLALLVGGDADAVDRCREPFSRFASLVSHFGPVGAGTRAKLARNLLHFVSFTATAEANRLAEAAGLDLGELGKVVRHSDSVTGGAGAVMLRATTAPIPADDFLHGPFSHAAALGEKDLALALELGRSLGVDLPLAELAHDRLAEALGVPHVPHPDPEHPPAPTGDPR